MGFTNVPEGLFADLQKDLFGATQGLTTQWVLDSPDTGGKDLGQYSPLHNQNNGEAERERMREQQQLQAAKMELLEKRQAYTEAVMHFSTGAGVDLVSPPPATFRNRGMR